jgi:hypothetical protein
MKERKKVLAQLCEKSKRNVWPDRFRRYFPGDFLIRLSPPGYQYGILYHRQVAFTQHILGPGLLLPGLLVEAIIGGRTSLLIGLGTLSSPDRRHPPGIIAASIRGG